MVTSQGKIELPEDMADTLDMVDVEKCDLVLNVYNWKVNGKSGKKAYLDSIYLTAYEDELSREYRDIPVLTNGPARPAIEGSKSARLELTSGDDGILDGEVMYDSDEEPPY